MSATVEQLAEAAGQAASAGHWGEAERLWRAVWEIHPRHHKALFHLGAQALKRGEAAVACDFLRSARAEAPDDLLVLMVLASASKLLGNAEQEFEAIQAALVINPYFVPALLARGAWLERQGDAAGASTTYANALKVSPPEANWPAAHRSQLEHARDYVGRHSAAHHAHISGRLAGLFPGLAEPLAERWREAASIMARRSQPYEARCNQLHVPRLPAIPFFDPAEFPWVADLEAKTSIIRAELLGAQASVPERFNPYINYKPWEPANQFGVLNRSKRWSAFHLWRNGKPVDENLAVCPETASVLAGLPLMDLDGLCPNAMFSALAPRSHIPPHQGETNARLVVHLPLIVPEGCSYRVGFEQRRWTVGKVLIFDDTIEHEARNDSDELRVILMFDIWNPLLQPEERKMVQALSAASREFQSESAI